MQDVFFRIGGATAGSATDSLVVNSSHVILDDIWAWRADHGAGAAFLISPKVTSFTGYGLGSYCFVNQGLPNESATAFRVPDVPGVQLHDLLTRFLNATGGIEHVVNDTGAAVDSASPRPPPRAGPVRVRRP